MFALTWTIGRVLKVAQLVLSGIVVAKDAVDMFRDKAEKDD